MLVGFLLVGLWAALDVVAAQTSQISIPAGVFIALDPPDTSRGIGSSQKHVSWAHNPVDGRLYSMGGDFNTPNGAPSSYRQDMYSLSIAERWANRSDRNAGWRLEYPYCGPNGGVQPKSPDFVGWTWDSKRKIFWMLPGTMVAPVSAFCPDRTVSTNDDPKYKFRHIMTFDPSQTDLTKRWKDISSNPGPGVSGVELWQSVYDPVTDSIVRFSYSGGSGDLVSHYNIAAGTWTTYGLGTDAVGRNHYIHRGMVAADTASRHIYAVGGDSGRLYRYHIDQHRMEDLGSVPGGSISFGSDASNNSYSVWDSVNKVLLFFRIDTRTIHIYKPSSRTWESPTVVTDPPGQRPWVRHAMVFDPYQNVLALMGHTESGSKIWLYRYAQGSTSSPPPSSDTTKPTVSVTSPVGGSTVSGSISVAATATDNVGVVGVQFKVDGVNVGAEDTTAPYGVTWATTGVGNGTHSVTAVARDAAGNTTTSAAVTVTVSNTTTSGTLAITNVSRTNYQVATLGVGSQYYVDRTYTLSSVPSMLAGGVWIKTANNDKASTGTSFLSFTVNVPVTVYVSYSTLGTTLPGWLSGWTNTGATVGTTDVTFRVYSKAFGAGTVTLGGNLASPAVGATEMYVVTVKASGSTTSGTLAITNVSRTSYQVATLGVGSQYYVDRTYTLSSIPAVLSGGLWIKTANNDKGSTGTTFLSFTVNVPVTVYVSYSVEATALPAWLSGWTNTGATLVTTSAAPFRVYSKAFGAGTVTLGGNLASPAAGPTQMYVVTVKASGTSSTSATTASGDTTKPTVSITAPAAGATVSGTVTVAATATDNVGVVGVQFQVDGANVGAEDTTAPYAVAWGTTGVENGTHTLTAVARDGAGNVQTSAAVSVTVANGVSSRVVGPTEAWCSAINSAAPGTEVILLAGSYTSPCGITAVGTATAPVVVRSQNEAAGSRATFAYAGSTANVIEFRDAAYVVLRGVTFAPTQAGVDAIRIRRANDVVIEGNEFAAIGGISVAANDNNTQRITVRQNTFTDLQTTGLYFGCHDGAACHATDILIEGNLIDGVTSPGVGYGIEVKLNSWATVRGNTILRTQGPGVMVYGSNRGDPASVVEQNYIEGSLTEGGVVVGGGPAIVRNNVLVGNAYGGVSAQDYNGRNLQAAVWIVHNTVLDNGDSGINVQNWQAGRGNVLANNAIRPRSGTAAVRPSTPAGTVTGNLTCGATSGCWEQATTKPYDLVPAAGSPLVDAGGTGTEGWRPAEDFEGMPRDSRPDVGAFER
jgi:hypothetical protein